MSFDNKKKSFYVLFLGAKESQGLRGSNYIEPVLQYFVSQEHRMQALKVTLQLSSKGLRIIPSNLRITSSGSGIISNAILDTSQTEKHFIPHHAITCVFQGPPPNDDIVSCILLIYNPDTKCPVHVHCYRCDTAETATVLREQFEGLVNREENQRKFKDIETRLQSKGLLPCLRNPTSKCDQAFSQEFDCRKSDSSENSDRGFGSGGSGSSNLTTDRVASLYDSLAAELREKLSIRKQNTPLLLPPRDYDTMHRQRGNLSGIEGRRCSNPAVVGAGNRERRPYTSREQDSCGRSSGIGSAEDNCSPINDPVLDNQAVPSSSDDEDWNSNQIVVTESSQYLVKPIWPASPKVSRRSSSSPIPPPLPKRPELRQRAPEMTSTPPAPVFSKERFEGVRKKWERLDHQYVKQKTIPNTTENFDAGFRTKEAAEADYRRQLSRESLLRSASRSNKDASRDSLDRWVESGIRSRGAWRKLEENAVPTLDSGIGSRPFYQHEKNSGSVEHLIPGTTSSNSKCNRRSGDINAKPSLLARTSTNLSSSSHRHHHQDLSNKKVVGKGYRELTDQERFPGLDRESARALHSSSFNLNHQHIYSEPSFETSLLVPSSQSNNNGSSKHKKFSFAFWKN